ncbi:DNA primase DnaG [Halovivax gelatinilyticus]|uniref:DNA primase DnaG n=1 Tax=Halovivax gelatinilyticus TaxID=2961597 RepID=UPI0020CA40B3|nr:DNA primase DnaG [Halovivax gelatinilyticus]
MEDTEKYLIHAIVTADGVVERSDVVGAIFGQTEGLLGDELDLPELRRTGKVGRIDVSVGSGGGESRGTITIASSLDKVETATLSAALETIDRVGPCRASFRVDEIEDVRAAKRREVVDRATELLRTGFEDSVMSSAEILAAVREHVRVADVTEYEGLPAGPRVADGDAIIVVEGRSDVLRLLSYGIKNAVAVEGTNVPDPIASLTAERTTTAFLDADRGGDLILEELLQVGSVDYVARPPAGASVEDLDHHDVFTALQNKTPIEAAGDPESSGESTDLVDAGEAVESIPATDGSATPAPPAETEPPDSVEERPDTESASAVDDSRSIRAAVSDATGAVERSDESPAAETAHGPDESERLDAPEPTDLYAHVDAIVRADSGQVRFLDDAGTVIEDAPTDEAGDLVETLSVTPTVMVLDGKVSQQLLDRAAAVGVSTIIADSLGQFVKRPAAVDVHAAEDVADHAP